MKRILKGFAVTFVTLALILVGLGFLANEPRPTGTPGPEADALAKKMGAAVNKAAWDKTGAVSWSFHGVHHYVWDRQRGFVEAKWGDTRVLLRTADQTGLAWKDGEQLQDEGARKTLDAAYKYWINDSFWLNPVVKFFDPGITRSLVTLEGGGNGLLVSYSSGGVTPGDAYLWMADENGLPTEWRMWVQIIPVGGLGTTWQGWTDLRTGAKISTVHDALGMSMHFIEDPNGAANLAELGVDPELFSLLTSQ